MNNKINNKQIKDKELEIIDFDLLNSNTIVIYYGKNGKQYGDDWNDTPYNCNAGEVYSQFIVEKKIYVVNPDKFTLEEYADKFNWNNPNCDVSKNDFIQGRVPFLELFKYDNYQNNYIKSFSFGDKKSKIEELVLLNNDTTYNKLLNDPKTKIGLNDVSNVFQEIK